MLPLHVTGLVVQSQEGHRRVDSLPALGTQPHNLEAGLMDLLRQLVDSNVTGSAHQHWPGGTKVTKVTKVSLVASTTHIAKPFLKNINNSQDILGFLDFNEYYHSAGTYKVIKDLPVALSGQVVDDGCRGYRLPRARRTLDQTERTLQHGLHGVHLRHNKPHVYMGLGGKRPKIRSLYETPLRA